MGRWTTVPLTVAVLGSACAGEDTTVVTTRSDSAGVVIVMNAGPDRPGIASTRVEDRLGGEPTGPESFYQIYPRQVSVGPSGVIGVLNRPAYQAVTFSPDGELLATYGSEGGGPGEFRYPSSIAMTPNGEVLVYDYEKRALVGFAADGTVLDERRLTVPFHGLDMVGTDVGLILLSEIRPRGDGPVTRRILHLSPTDTVQLGPSLHTTSKTVQYRSCGVTLSQPPVFSADLVWASYGARTAVAAGPEYSIRIFDDTTLAHVVRRDIRPEAVTEEVARREVGEGEIWYVGSQECLVPADEVLEQRGYDPLVPVVEAVAVTPSGGLWVRRRNPGTQERSLDVFDRDGRYLETVSPSPPFPIAFLPDGRYLTIERDSLDVETLAIRSVALDGG